VKNFWTRFVNETDGQDLIEYALLAATIALGTIAGMRAIRDAVNTEFTNIGASISAGS
jgi:Flp pilus assembly pilin Flp